MALPRHSTLAAPARRRAIYPAAEGKHCKIGWPIRAMQRDRLARGRELSDDSAALNNPWRRVDDSARGYPGKPSDWQGRRKAMAGKVGKKNAMTRVRSTARKKIGKSARAGKASTAKAVARKSPRARAPAKPVKAAKRVRAAPVKSSLAKTTAKRRKPRAAQVASAAPRAKTAPSAASMMPASPAAAPQKPAVPRKPTTVPSPIASQKPTTPPKPTVSQKPTASPKPTISQQPTASPKPTISQEPTASPKPAISQKSMVSPNPTVSQNRTAPPGPAVALSPAAQKKLAGEHLRALLEQKKRRATQTPAWQTIEHHDHAPRDADHQPHGGDGVADGDAARDPDDRGES
jgi:hypothetical protein